MNRLTLTLIGLGALTAGTAAFATAQRAGVAAREPVERAAEAAPRKGGVHGLLYARPFELGEAYANSWRADGGPVSAGWLVVLAVDRALVEPRDEAEPILYAGDQTVERISQGHASGRVIAVVPGADRDLAAMPFWFGNPALPETVTAASLARERAAAERAGVAPFDGDVIAQARARGGETLALADHGALRRAAAELILAWSEDERELAEGILAPLVR